MASRRDRLRALRQQVPEASEAEASSAGDFGAAAAAAAAAASGAQPAEPPAKRDKAESESEAAAAEAAAEAQAEPAGAAAEAPAEVSAEEAAELQNYRLAASDDDHEKYKQALQRLSLQQGLAADKAEEYAQQVVAEDVLEQVTKSAVEDVLSLAPRKVDWDLKRDIDERLGKLNRRTQKAIAELVRDRLQNNSTAAAQ